ncbi:MAG: hypothetical protein KKA79_09730 [Nanoarchaeota archaeon]|nr:hypothetical protein [Nanoarchaeota archaeon]MCG2718613.1 hypothetical protein [Nanoarchaeota archaeon]
MKKGQKKNAEDLIPPIAFKNIKFNKGLFTVFLAILILLLAFLLSSDYILRITPEVESTVQGDECILTSDCPQPRCPGVKNICRDGYCLIWIESPSAAKCIDLKVPICGNDICEGDEECPEDCDPNWSEKVCNNDGNCEYDLTEKYADYSENENSNNCPNDCYCEDGICDEYEMESGDCPFDCLA